MLRISTLVIVTAAAAVAAAATVLPVGSNQHQQLEVGLLASRVEPHPNSTHLPLCAVSEVPLAWALTGACLITALSVWSSSGSERGIGSGMVWQRLTGV